MSASYYYLTARFDHCVPWRQVGSCSMTSPFLSLRRVWLARLDSHLFIPDRRGEVAGQSIMLFCNFQKTHTLQHSSTQNIPEQGQFPDPSLTRVWSPDKGHTKLISCGRFKKCKLPVSGCGKLTCDRSFGHFVEGRLAATAIT